ncbi:MAG TPA: hypothetical protein VFK05_28840 [Polyangiaceae bacterium]|nr:hypothetical protein [Polyangiaceae bacterium]
MNIRRTATLLVFASGASACSASVVDLDAAPIAASNEPGVLAIVHERVEKIIVDDERLYWIGTRLPRSSNRDLWFLHSCQKRNCARTRVTYDERPYDYDSGNFSIGGGKIFWYRGDSSELLSCAVAGCDGAPRVLATEPTSTAALDADYFYFSNWSSLYRVSLKQPASPELIADSPSGVLKIAVQGAYVYFLAEQPEGKSWLLRTRKDGSSGVESVAPLLNISLYGEFGVTSDETFVYWTNNVLRGSINRCPLSGCSAGADVLLSPLRAPQSLLIDGTRLYYHHEVEAYDYALSSCALPSCAASAPVQEHVDTPSVLALDDRYLYVATSEQDFSPSNTGEDPIAQIRQLPKPAPDSP